MAEWSLGPLQIRTEVERNYDGVLCSCEWDGFGRRYRSQMHVALSAIEQDPRLRSNEQWQAHITDWAIREWEKVMAPSSGWSNKSYAEWAKHANQLAQQQMSSYYNPNNITSNTSGNYYASYQNAPYSPPPMWHNFPCGHQIKLEPGQPIPGRCTLCPTDEWQAFTYPKCGHVFNHTKAMLVPTLCPECVREEQKQKQAAEAAEKERLAVIEAREAEAKNPLAWLDKQLAAVAVSV